MHVLAIVLFLAVTCIVSGHSPRPLASLDEEERRHLRSHHADLDPDSLAEDELRFLYFQTHDSDRDGRLDGCELVHSLLHWHETEQCDDDRRPAFGHDELALMVDPVLDADDADGDGFIDYREFVAAQKTRGFF